MMKNYIDPWITAFGSLCAKSLPSQHTDQQISKLFVFSLFLGSITAATSCVANRSSTSIAEMQRRSAIASSQAKKEDSSHNSPSNKKQGERTFLTKVGDFLKPKHRTFLDMDFDELQEIRKKHASDSDTYAKYTERLITLCSDADKRAELTLELADALFALGKYDKANARYTEFSKFYPGHDKTEYALYQAIIASHKRILSYDRDQTKTQETIDLANSFLERDIFTTYRADVETIRSDCYQRMIESELHVCQFYLKREKFKSIETRLAHIRTTMLANAQPMQERIEAFEKEVVSAKKQSAENRRLAEMKRIEVATKKYEKLTKRKKRSKKHTDQDEKLQAAYEQQLEKLKERYAQLATADPTRDAAPEGDDAHA